jgi:hypothetical protein
MKSAASLCRCAAGDGTPYGKIAFTISILVLSKKISFKRKR